jgi:two-component system sensor histidine kinase BarA
MHWSLTSIRKPDGSMDYFMAMFEDITCIAVSDTGIGIPEDQLPRLFSEFSQLDSGFARAHQGTGLGLALSKRLVFGMGGTIQVESKKGSGSTFTVLIPRSAPSSA